MTLHTLTPARGARKNSKRVGRGPGSGHGTYSGRGLKGQKARMAGKPPRGFEGGQMPLQRRLPKRGFTNVHKVVSQPVNLADLERRADVDAFTLDTFYALGLASRNGGPVKVLARGTIGRAVQVEAHRFSTAAREAIEAAGGIAHALEPPRRKRGKFKAKEASPAAGAGVAKGAAARSGRSGGG